MVPVHAIKSVSPETIHQGQFIIVIQSPAVYTKPRFFLVPFEAAFQIKLQFYCFFFMRAIETTAAIVSLSGRSLNRARNSSVQKSLLYIVYKVLLLLNIFFL